MSSAHESEEPRIRFTNNRKIDREQQAQQSRQADGGATTPPSAADPVEDPTATADEPATEEEVPMIEAALLDERTADLQRLQAEYANYRRRAERDRLAAGDLAVGRVLADLLPVLDDLERTRAHDDLTGPLKAVADKLDATVTKLGLFPFGVVGDPFDPSIHEAVLHDESDDVDVPTCTTVMRPGFKHHDRLLRPAMVGVTDPTNPSTADASPILETVDVDDEAEADPSGPPENEVRDGHSETEEAHADT